MISIDIAMLRGLGLPDGLPAQEVDRLLRFFCEQLTMRVGRELAGRMTDEQLDEFEGYVDARDKAGAHAWLQRTFPDNDEVVQEHYRHLLDELQSTLPAIVADIQQRMPSAA